MISGLQHVLVIGGGISGMATAIPLLRQGVAVDIIDVDPDWKVYGAGITITGATLRAFRDLGFLDAIAEHGFLSAGAHMHLFNGTLLAETVQLPVEPGLPAAGGIMRPKLHQILSDEVRRLGAHVRLGITAERLEDKGEHVDVTFSDGSRCSYDLVVGADGIYSKTRSQIFGRWTQPVYTGQMSWRIMADRPADMDLSHFYFGHENIGGIIPCSATQMYAFILQPEPNPRRIPAEQQPDFLKALLADFGGLMGEVRDGVTAQSSIVQRPFEYALQQRPWSKGRAVIIGDAAHATTAHLASGAGIAVEDGLVLAQELARADGDVPAALEAFESRRYERCKFVVESSVAIGVRQLERAPAEEIGMRMGKAMHYLAGAI